MRELMNARRKEPKRKRSEEEYNGGIGSMSTLVAIDLAFNIGQPPTMWRGVPSHLWIMEGSTAR
jgi:hypothetical protein